MICSRQAAIILVSYSMLKLKKNLVKFDSIGDLLRQRCPWKLCMAVDVHPLLPKAAMNSLGAERKVLSSVWYASDGSGEQLV